MVDPFHGRSLPQQIPSTIDPFHIRSLSRQIPFTADPFRGRSPFTADPFARQVRHIPHMASGSRVGRVLSSDWRSPRPVPRGSPLPPGRDFRHHCRPHLPCNPQARCRA
eukprot:6482521-Prymnesium_polylepis.1